MKYRVHRIKVDTDHHMQEKLEQFINQLEGEVISVGIVTSIIYL